MSDTFVGHWRVDHNSRKTTQRDSEKTAQRSIAGESGESSPSYKGA
jgi:hypothetical protein